MTSHLALLAEEINGLANAARISGAPEDVAEKSRMLTRQAIAMLEEHAWPGPYAVEQLAPPETSQGLGGYTQMLTVTYRRPTPIGMELELWAHTAGQTGDVFLTSAEVRYDGKVTASAVAVHKAAGRHDERVYPNSQR